MSTTTRVLYSWISSSSAIGGRAVVGADWAEETAKGEVGQAQDLFAATGFLQALGQQCGLVDHRNRVAKQDHRLVFFLVEAA